MIPVGTRVRIAPVEGEIIDVRITRVGRTKRTAREIRRYLVQLPSGRKQLVAEEHLVLVEEAEE